MSFGASGFGDSRWDRPASASFCMGKMPEHALVHRRPGRQMVVLVPLCVHRAPRVVVRVQPSSSGPPCQPYQSVRAVPGAAELLGRENLSVRFRAIRESAGTGPGVSRRVLSVRRRHVTPRRGSPPIGDRGGRRFRLPVSCRRSQVVYGVMKEGRW